MTETRADSHGPLGSPVLDIGDGVGALVVRTDAALEGHEVEVSPVGRDRARVHADVLPRRVGDATVHAVVIAGLRAGRYVLWRLDGEPFGEVEIRDGEVTEVDWRS